MIGGEDLDGKGRVYLLDLSKETFTRIHSDGDNKNKKSGIITFPHHRTNELFYVDLGDGSGASKEMHVRSHKEYSLTSDQIIKTTQLTETKLTAAETKATAAETKVAELEKQLASLKVRTHFIEYSSKKGNLESVITPINGAAFRSDDTNWIIEYWDRFEFSMIFRGTVAVNGHVANWKEKVTHSYIPCLVSSNSRPYLAQNSGNKYLKVGDNAAATWLMVSGTVRKTNPNTSFGQ